MDTKSEQKPGCLASLVCTFPLIVSYLICTAGTVQYWTDRCIQAIGCHLQTYVHWPTLDERYNLKAHIKSIHGIPHCLGFIDGCHINLERAPTRPGKTAGAFHSRKERYGFNVVAAVDDKKRFIYLHWGFSAASSDQRVQRSMVPQTHPERFFDNGEWLLADAGFTCSPNIIPMYKRGRGKSHLHGRMAYFNKKAAEARVAVEHAFGVLKGRWASLRYLRLKVKSKKDEAQALGMIQCACILHNMLITTWIDVLPVDELQAIMDRERRMQQRRVVDPGAGQMILDTHRRRERLVTEMLEIDEDEVDLETCML